MARRATVDSSAEFNPFEMARSQFDKIADQLQLDTSTRRLLRSPLREFRFLIPVRMDDGHVESFEGFRIQHNDACGPCMGGVRFHPQETLDTIRALAMWMTWKTAAIGLPVGGSMGGVICDPHTLSEREQESISRGWIRQMARNLGPEIDVPAPDMMTDSKHMLWMLSEYESIKGGHHPGAITGKPEEMGGSLGRRQATGYGIVYCLREAFKELDLSARGVTASVQGFGKVAQHAIELLDRIGGSTVCVTSWDQRRGVAHSFRKSGGIDLAELRHITDSLGTIDADRAGKLGYEVLPADTWFEQDVDVLIPAALENSIAQSDLDRMSNRVKIIAEGANGAISEQAEQILLEGGTFVIPDLIANGGGVISSYFEHVQSRMNYFWELAEVIAKLDMKITSAYVTISELARTRQLSLRDAAIAIAIDRVATLCRERGLA
ncbi:MAG: Glu/Leu/Phe/Val dehydrogenase [bacterium]|nr:Glu/Leu/Phe/Val dehydrogenase [bacterium]